MSELTKAQELASNPKLTAWVGASAGTGKTHVLTTRVLRLLLAGNDPAKILCLTYTKAAAAEMTNRVYGELGNWVTLNDAALEAALNTRTGEVADADMLRLARQLFARVLDLPGGLKIQTIHSFCQSILTRFPLEAQLPPGFEVVEEGAAAHMLADARDQLLTSLAVSKNPVMTRSINWVATRTTEETFDKVMGSLISKADVLRRLFNSYQTEDAVAAALYRSLSLKPTETAESIRLAACADDVLDSAGLKALADTLEGGTKGDKDRAVLVKTFLAASEFDRPKYLDDYASVFITKTRTQRAERSKWMIEALEVQPTLEAEAGRLLGVNNTCDTVLLAENTKALLVLGIDMYQRYLNLKNQMGKLDFNDIIDRTGDLLKTEAIAPWILYKLDEGIDHILVDEAQDTNKQQWQIIETLASEFFLVEAEDGPTRTIFSVGDPKQSIFSFQKADPREFIEAKDRVFAAAQAAGRPHEAVPLDQSFRTSEAVLSVVDAVFARGGPAFDGLTFDDADIKHDFVRSGQAGSVELWPLVAPRERETRLPWQPPTTQESGEEAGERLAHNIAKHIKRILDAGEIMPATGAPVTAGDIMVLVRRRNVFCEYLASALRRQGIAVAGRDRMKLGEELPVMDLIALTRFALQPADDLTLAEVLKSPFIGLSEDALFELAHSRDGSLWAALTGVAETSDTYREAYMFLRTVLTSADQVPPYEFYADILNKMGGRKRLVARLGGEIHDPVDEFLQQALFYERDNPASLQGFLKVFSDSSTEIKRDMEQGRKEVRIMTVHGAKGLQAPLVILPDTVINTDPSHTLFEFTPPHTNSAQQLLWKVGDTMKHEPHIKKLAEDKLILEDAEYRRLLYVALTRAEDALIICGWETQKKRKERSWYNLVEDAFERMEGVETLDSEVRIITREQTKELIRKTLDESGKSEHQGLPAWALNPPEPEPVPARPLIPSMPDEPDPAPRSPLGGVSSARYHRGRIIHGLLEWLPDVAAPAREEAAMRFLSDPAHGLSDQEQQATWQEINTVLSDDTFAALFGADSQAEVALAGLVGDEIISGQVDRLVVTKDKVLVVDYKTNRPVPKNVDAMPAVYKKQMRAYARALKEIYPDRSVEAAILWTDEAQLMALPAEMLV